MTDIEAQIPAAVQSVLGGPVERFCNINKGITNDVFKVVTARQVLLLKVFRIEDWPEDGKLQWVERQLAARHIAHTRILHYTRDKTLFPHGFMISEWVAGRGGECLLQDGPGASEEFYEKMGTLLKSIHDIKARAYGYLNEGAGTHPDFVAQRLEVGCADVDQLRRADADLYQRVRTKVVALLTPLAHRFSPVLTHGDPHPRNCLWSEGQLMLVDWDNAAASVWIRDYAHLTYLRLCLSPQPASIEQREQLRACFFKGYGATDFTQVEIAQVEDALHVLWAYNSLSYLRQTKPETFRRAQDFLLSRL